MNCCNATSRAEHASGKVVDQASLLRREELARSGKMMADGSVQYLLSVPGIHCGHCISTIEKIVSALDGVVASRVNLTMKRLSFTLKDKDASPVPVQDSLAQAGYPAFAIEIGNFADLNNKTGSVTLLKAVAVAGFAAANIMLLSISIWSGAQGTTRDLFHLISALIALPAAAYSGQVFFKSAFSALKAGRLNMDVPISLAVILALAMSSFETFTGGDEAYFDAAISLLFFLLVGRYLDHLMRDRARNAVIGLSHMAVKGATQVQNDGKLNYLPIDEVEPGMIVRVAAGERIAVDARIVKGDSDLDRSFVTGESAPARAIVGNVIEAGTLNLTGPLDMEVVHSAKDSFLSEVLKMLEAAEQGRGQYVRIADRMAKIYAPAVHLLAASAFIGWMIATGGDWHTSIYTAIAVLIITCPCALGLAVPVVHVIAAAKLFEAGILMKDGSAVERLGEADHVVFDKTGTLTSGEPKVVGTNIGDAKSVAIAKALGVHSIHPASRAISEFFKASSEAHLEKIGEVPGNGVEAICNGKRVRLGRLKWVREIAKPAKKSMVDLGNLAFAIEGRELSFFQLSESLRPEAASSIKAIVARGIDCEIVSGDGQIAVQKIASQLALKKYSFDQTPADKIKRLQQLQDQGYKVLMVGDGLNDAPALAAGHVSMAPSSACDVGRLAADFVFTRDSLNAIPFAFETALRAKRLVQQNFALTILYNFIAVPLAVGGFVTPLIAAIAMSASSIAVVTNSLRLTRVSSRADNFDGKSAKLLAAKLTGSVA